MKLSVLLFLSLNGLVAYAALAPRTNDVLAEQLYNSVVVGDYTNAAQKAIELEGQHKGSVITDTVNRLLDDGKRASLEFAYKLWNAGGQEIVKHYFPIQFRIIFDGNYVKFINKRDNLAVKFGVAKDGLGDRTAYGDGSDKTSDRLSFKFIPIWEGERVYFKVLNIKTNQYLKLAQVADDMGDHTAYGGDESDTFRHQWYLQPVKYEKNLLFFIYNREFNQALKMGRAVDGEGDRTVYGHKGNVEGSPDLFGWYLTPY